MLFKIGLHTIIVDERIIDVEKENDIDWATSRCVVLGASVRKNAMPTGCLCLTPARVVF